MKPNKNGNFFMKFTIQISNINKTKWIPNKHKYFENRPLALGLDCSLWMHTHDLIKIYEYILSVCVKNINPNESWTKWVSILIPLSDSKCWSNNNQELTKCESIFAPGANRERGKKKKEKKTISIYLLQYVFDQMNRPFCCRMKKKLDLKERTQKITCFLAKCEMAQSIWVTILTAHKRLYAKSPRSFREGASISTTTTTTDRWWWWWDFEIYFSLYRHFIACIVLDANSGRHREISLKAAESSRFFPPDKTDISWSRNCRTPGMERVRQKILSRSFKSTYEYTQREKCPTVKE